MRARPDARIRVYVVWLPILGADTRSTVDAGLLADRRVTQLWDGDRLIGRWLAETDVGGQATSSLVWDAYFLFGPDALWNERPAPVVGSGAPVIGNTASLEEEVAKLLG